MSYKKTNYRKNTFKRKYNINTYKLVKKTNKLYTNLYKDRKVFKIIPYF